MTLAALDRYDEARTQLERSIALRPDQTQAYFQLGILELHANNWDRASANLRRVLDRNPRHAGALAALGRIAFDEKHYPEAIERLRQAIAIDDTLGQAHYNLALSYARMGRKSEAQEEFQRATQLDREDTEKRRRVLNRLDLMPANPTSQ
jgi:tetratricopeptide (TPR) repeat protein